MTRADDLLALAEACEKATGPDRDLDTEILWHVDRHRFTCGYWQAASGMPRELEVMPSPKGGLGWIGAQCSAPAYTASLDAAKKLTPEGCFLRLYGEFPQAIIVRWDGRAYQEVARSLCALTDETAVVSANLRALAAIETGAAA